MLSSPDKLISKKVISYGELRPMTVIYKLEEFMWKVRVVHLSWMRTTLRHDGQPGPTLSSTEKLVSKKVINDGELTLMTIIYMYKWEEFMWKVPVVHVHRMRTLWNTSRANVVIHWEINLKESYQWQWTLMTVI